MLRILAADDSPTSRAIVDRLIGGSFALTLAASGAEVLELLRHDSFDLLLLDLLMPGMDGWATLEAILAEGLELKTVVITADVQDTSKARLATLGIEAVVNKPLTREKLMAGIAAAFPALEGRFP